MNNRPLSYPSLKCVLEHMDPNLRLKLTDRVPSIRFAEKATPFYLQDLVISSLTVIVNNTRYQLGIRRHFPTEPVPTYFQMENDEGGASCDLDRFGREDLEAENEMFPGDISISDPPIVQRNLTEQEYRDAIIFEMTRLEELKAVEDPSIEEQREMDSARSNIFNWELVEKNEKAPYQMYIQLTVTDETTKKVLKKELPLGLQLKIQELAVGTRVKSTFNAFKTVFSEESFPLDWIGIDGDLELEEPDNHDHENVRSAKRLSIGNENPGHSLFHIVVRVQNPEAYFIDCLVASDEFVAVADKMVDDQRSIDTEFKFEVTNAKFMEEMFERLCGRMGAIKQKEEERGCKQFPHTIRLPMRDGLTLSIFCYDQTGYSDWDPLVPKWMLHMKVETLVIIPSRTSEVINVMWKSIMQTVDGVLFLRKLDLV